MLHSLCRRRATGVPAHLWLACYALSGPEELPYLLDHVAALLLVPKQQQVTAMGVAGHSLISSVSEHVAVQLRERLSAAVFLHLSLALPLIALDLSLSP